MKTSFVLLSTICFSSSCMTYDPYTDEQKVSNSTKGAVAGALAGAALGNQVKGSRNTRNDAQIAGAVIGAMAGGAVGNDMDKKEANLRHRLKGTGVRIKKEGDRLVLNTPGAITFDTNSSLIKPEFAEVLDSISLVLKEYSKSSVEISGHTDGRGNVHANQLLSEQRANSVASYLRVHGVARSRITTVGYGKSTATNKNDDPQGRRVEIQIIN